MIVFNNKNLTYFILAVFIFSTCKYHIRYNHNKKFIELSNVNFNLSENPIRLDRRLKGLKWITPHYPEHPSHEINLLMEAKDILLQNEGSF